MDEFPRLVRYGIRVGLSVLVVLLMPFELALGQRTTSPQGVPPNDECVDAIDLPQGLGTCAVSDVPCASNDDCAMAECVPDGVDCTADASVCDDLCANKVCSDGPNVGLACFDNEDLCVEGTCSASGNGCTIDDDCTGGCPGGFCDGTCSRSGTACFGPPGVEPQCAGLDGCRPERCIFREFGSIVGAQSAGEWMSWVPGWYASDEATVPGIWYRVVGTGNAMFLSTCNPGTDYEILLDLMCAGCDRLNRFHDEQVLAPPFKGDCEREFGWCTQKGAEYQVFVGGIRNTCKGSCALSGTVCGTDDDCAVNTCDGVTCLTGEDCLIDDDCPANACQDTTCRFTGETCTNGADCLNRPTGDFELSFWDDGTPCRDYNGPTDCRAGNEVLAVDTVLTDNGDADAWADSRETVDMRVRFRNHGDRDLTGLVAEIATDDPKIAGISVDTIDIGSLAAGETRLSAEAFEFTVAAVDRTSVAEDFAVTFDVVLRSDAFDGAHRPQQITLELDLDGGAGAGPTVFHEGFESGDLGAFAPMNLDLGRDSLADSDGFRCQYNDPDAPSLGTGRPSCYLGGTPAHAEAFYWNADDQRAYTGLHSLHMGDYVDDAPVAPQSVLEAVRSGDPINLGQGSVCSSTRTTACDVDGDCPAGESCVGVAPELSFKHQVALLGWRQSCDVCDSETDSCTGTGSFIPCKTRADCPEGEVCRGSGINSYPTRGTNRGVVQAQLADSAGNPVGDWIKLQPYVNVYDKQASNWFFNCLFDPVDDGNTEDDLYDPGFPSLPLGPSSSCYPEFNFNEVGNTDRPFDPDLVGEASDGPGLEGESGIGTWIETKVSLTRFQGQRVRLRFLNTSIEIHGLPFFGPGAFQGTAGWWIDDVTVTDALVGPATLDVDDKTCEPGVDQDGDTVRDCIDCAPRNAQGWSLPGQIRDLSLMHTGSADGTTSLSWTAPDPAGATQLEYVTVVRGPASCDESTPAATTTATDTTVPAPGELLQFLIRPDNVCGSGPLGRDSFGNLRGGCP